MADDERTTNGDVDPRDIPPADSNEALHVAEDKRQVAHKASGVGPARAKAARERQAAAFAESGSDAPAGDEGNGGEREDKESGSGTTDRERAARSQPPAGRTTKPNAKS